ncbi:unknown [Candidatus Colimorpha enterica]|uniref:Uncharacterized protein n=1 Tax=Candidatus Colimorpha enterica TaxID=3083063 RepID=R6U3M5_9BACT|nr:unknown [Candidatus Colimorpha enterica]
MYHNVLADYVSAVLGKNAGMNMLVVAQDNDITELRVPVAPEHLVVVQSEGVRRQLFDAFYPQHVAAALRDRHCLRFVNGVIAVCKLRKLSVTDIEIKAVIHHPAGKKLLVNKNIKIIAALTYYPALRNDGLFPVYREIAQRYVLASVKGKRLKMPVEYEFRAVPVDYNVSPVFYEEGDGLFRLRYVGVRLRILALYPG